MQMMEKTEIHKQFLKEEFDVIVIDEVHHVGAESYQRIMNYFEPKFWLGITASPDTNNYNVYSIFDY
jgi:superfamily II DNA or RNA helicase